MNSTMQYFLVLAAFVAVVLAAQKSIVNRQNRMRINRAIRRVFSPIDTAVTYETVTLIEIKVDNVTQGTGGRDLQAEFVRKVRDHTIVDFGHDNGIPSTEYLDRIGDGSQGTDFLNGSKLPVKIGDTGPIRTVEDAPASNSFSSRGDKKRDLKASDAQTETEYHSVVKFGPREDSIREFLLRIGDASRGTDRVNDIKFPKRIGDTVPIHTVTDVPTNDSFISRSDKKSDANFADLEEFNANSSLDSEEIKDEWNVRKSKGFVVAGVDTLGSFEAFLSLEEESEEMCEEEAAKQYHQRYIM
ncbi:hypothetical protein SARC_02425 [Sphaeroforma arctica JP610]|uniref:Uncharacterized protein n=1 Tax=Sphaeroforma arctica JP610 TaxID=667725 RepID=A0A0L0G935_9EUKA|nr:hypothetical protein SARC_02425 [Sphaeroforma arctica JP610]KNC85391.1 hypothetical protein SARC_02425 [Sphaeroforma arctica JP610]|eukprot:XP_014159293.1 hypothetical protein SARC_02425 [Sphaeroforma arctica JP610]